MSDNVADGSDRNPPDDGWLLIEDQIGCLTSLARRRYAENTHREPWQEQEARWHIYKAADQLSVSSYHYRQGNLRAYEVNMADALNHMIMAMLVFGNDGGCHPVMADSLQAGGGETPGKTSTGGDRSGGG